jgi:hypothetical protein
MEHWSDGVLEYWSGDVLGPIGPIGPIGPYPLDPARRPPALKRFQIRFPLPSMTVNDRVDRCRPVTGWYIVPQERKLEAAAAE